MLNGLVVLVIDGFGIGAMPDAGELRPEDARADTLGSLVAWSRSERGQQLHIPHLAALGLSDLRPDLELATTSITAATTFRRAALGYPGADSFAGHQTMMGADMSQVTLAAVGDYVDQLSAVLLRAGHRVDLACGNRMLIVDGGVLVHDNLEADPRLNWNVSGRLSEFEWGQIEGIARLVRSIAPVARVIAVGGYSDNALIESVREGEVGTVGLDTPASGFYTKGGLKVNHLGAEIDYRHQLPEVAARAGLPVTLVGKASDILITESEVRRFPGVETEKLLDITTDLIGEPGLSVVNVQQTDLAGHQQDVGRYVSLIEQVDAAVGEWLPGLGDAGLVVTADHGNDPCIEHAFHTREYVPVLAASTGRGHSLDVDLATLADIAGGACVALGLDVDELVHGQPVKLI
ncbi:phosphopentomutase [Enemella sp. A6]|uniref:phosphopentomutase n=1 Tax=Enemella sp. A6 TaxID=3440152 RepID=UPI003EB84DF3